MPPPKVSMRERRSDEQGTAADGYRRRRWEATSSTRSGATAVGISTRILRKSPPCGAVHATDVHDVGHEASPSGSGFFAEQSMSASMVAHKLPSERTGEAVRVDRGGSNPRVAGADLGAAGDLSDEVEGRALPKGSSELRTATILVEHLNSHGAQGAPPHLYTGDREVAVDAVAEGETTLLLIQLTTRTDGLEPGRP